MARIGNASWLQVGVEGTYGGGATVAGYRMEIISANIDPVIGFIEDPSLFGGISPRGVYQGGLYYEGKIVVRADFYGLGRLMRGAFGSAVHGGTAAPYTHTYKEATAPPSLALELCEGDVANKVKIAVGVVVTSMSVKGTAGQGEGAMMTIEFSFIAKSVTTDQTASATLSFPATPKPWLFHQSTSDTTDGAGGTQSNLRIKSFQIDFTSPWQADRFYFGSLTPDAPVRSGLLSVEWNIVQDFINYDMFTKATAQSNNNVAPKLKISNSTESVEFRSNTARVTKYGNPVEGYGPLLANTTIKASRDGTDLSALVCVITNNDNQSTHGDDS